MDGGGQSKNEEYFEQQHIRGDEDFSGDNGRWMFWGGEGWTAGWTAG